MRTVIKVLIVGLLSVCTIGCTSKDKPSEAEKKEKTDSEIINDAIDKTYSSTGFHVAYTTEFTPPNDYFSYSTTKIDLDITDLRDNGKDYVANGDLYQLKLEYDTNNLHNGRIEIVGNLSKQKNKEAVLHQEGEEDMGYWIDDIFVHSYKDRFGFEDTEYVKVPNVEILNYELTQTKDDQNNIVYTAIGDYLFTGVLDDKRPQHQEHEEITYKINSNGCLSYVERNWESPYFNGLYEATGETQTTKMVWEYTDIKSKE